MKNILEIIKSIESELPNLNPTEIYNEGWMTRLLVYYSIIDKLKFKELDFSKIYNWCSEALISSPFLPGKRGDNLEEGFTHADMTIGDFKVDFSSRGEVEILEDAKLFGIIEAKMGSNLSQWAKNARNYNQASRYLAYIAHKTCNIDCDIFFSVVAPQSKLDEHKIDIQIDIQYMIEQIKVRLNEYPDSFKKLKDIESVIYKAQECRVWSMSYEEWIDEFDNSESKRLLNSFYESSKKWNRID